MDDQEDEEKPEISDEEVLTSIPCGLGPRVKKLLHQSHGITFHIVRHFIFLRCPPEKNGTSVGLFGLSSWFRFVAV